MTASVREAFFVTPEGLLSRRQAITIQNVPRQITMSGFMILRADFQ
jgi:hypothetical protein